MSSFVPPSAIPLASRIPPALLSRAERDRLIERGILGLYRWYVARSQETRNWNPDKGFNWRQVRHDFSEDVIRILQGFFAVEQYAPDYTSELLNQVRRSHGRSHFQLRWGSEEEKHADAWENALLFTRQRTPKWIADYKERLRAHKWTMPFPDAITSLVYTVFQERATQLNYLNLLKIARGKSDKAHMQGQTDPVIAQVAHTIAVDEVAHYNFFLEAVRLYLYYYPVKTLEAVQRIIQNFSMPASHLVPDWDKFFETVYKAGIFGPREFGRDVMRIVFRNLGIESRRALEAGLKRTREVPTYDEAGIHPTAIWDTFDYGQVEADVQRLHLKIQQFEHEVGFADLDPTEFVANPDVPAGDNAASDAAVSDPRPPSTPAG
jgi:acyl-[acyl-carrier-protein] desaturase